MKINRFNDLSFIIGHIGIAVPDVYAACKLFEEQGVTFVKKPDDGNFCFDIIILYVIVIIFNYTVILDKKQLSETNFKVVVLLEVQIYCMLAHFMYLPKSALCNKA